MNILGIHSFGHDTGAALISEGQVLAIGEERLNRMKHSGLFPHESVRYLLEAAGLKAVDDVDLIVGVTRLGQDGTNKEIDMIRSRLGYVGKIHTISHHTAHAASAFYPSPFDEATAMVIDGLGSNAADLDDGAKKPFIFRVVDRKMQKQFEEVQSFYRATDGRLYTIRKDYAMPGFSNGLGLLYMGTSVFIGLGDFGSGKVMGLAPYGGRTPGRRFRRSFYEIVDGRRTDTEREEFCQTHRLLPKALLSRYPQEGEGRASGRRLYGNRLRGPGRARGSPC